MTPTETGQPTVQEPAITPEILRDHGITPEEYDKILKSLGRTPTLTELGIFSVMWSEHCSYKSSRVHLKRLPTRSRRVVQGPGENAGIIDIGDGWACAFKIESHNHPSFIEPFQGATTGVGGILRDIFTMGARPVAVMDSLSFGPIKNPTPSQPMGRNGAPTVSEIDQATLHKNHSVMEGVVSGVASYGNCFGVPNLGGETKFEPCYSGNPLVNAFALGLVRRDQIFYAKAAGEGNPVIYVGSKTGRDGIHGATMASEEFSEESEAKRPNVQVGDPVHGEAAAGSLPGSHADRRDRRHSGHGRCRAHLLHLRDGRARRRWTGDRARPGAAARHRHDSLRDHAERVAGAHAAGRRKRPRRRSASRFRQVGTGCGHHRPSHQPADDARAGARQRRRRDSQPGAHRRGAALPSSAASLGAAGSARGSRASSAWRRRATSPRSSSNCSPARTSAPSAGSTSSTTPWCRPTPWKARAPRAASFASRERIAAWRWRSTATGAGATSIPSSGAMHAVAEAARNVACTGATPIAATNCLNFGNPEKPHIMWQFSQTIDGMTKACEELETPITGGNVSFYNETLGEGIYPTPVMGIVGILEDVHKAVGPHFKPAGPRAGPAARLRAGRHLRRRSRVRLLRVRQRGAGRALGLPSGAGDRTRSRTAEGDHRDD